MEAELAFTNAFTNALNNLTGEPPAPQNMMTRALNNVRDSNATAAMQNTLGVPAADSLCPSLSFKQRLYGCIGCFCVGIFLSIIGWFAWIGARARHDCLRNSPPTAPPPPQAATSAPSASRTRSATSSRSARPASSSARSGSAGR